MFARWGSTASEDPKYSPIGPEIADIEISTICSGPGSPCPFCYKSNTVKGKNMDLETFKNIFSKIKGNLTQIAFGIGDIDGNPQMMDIFKYCRSFGIVPNVTVNGYGINYDWVKELVSVCGAVAVSRYGDGKQCYATVSSLLSAGLKQVNIHQLLCEETFEDCYRTIGDVAIYRNTKDPTDIGGLNAIVFLMVKPKGRAKHGTFSPISMEHLKVLMEYAELNNVQIGFDSCAAPKVLCSVKEHKNFQMFKTCIEPCESTLFSAYINVDGDFFPCSFTEGEEEWKEGISVKNCTDFLSDVWYNPKVVSFRKKLLSTESIEVPNCYSPCRKCPVYKIY